VRILWDEPKRLANLDKHRLDFADLSPEFFTGGSVRPVRQDRLQAIGRHAGRTVAVIVRPLGSEAIAIVSMRPAKRRERKWQG
jgi:uncharacterized DUF497 family protein